MRLPALLPCETIFVGGGTPTQVSPEDLRRLLGIVTSRVDRSALAEFTVEANPGTLTSEKVAILREFGVTRVSLGAQSFDPERLAFLERIHGPDEIESGIACVRDGGIENVNLDLIYAIPGETVDSWMSDVRRALALAPSHLSAYALTFEEGTPLGARRQKGLVEPPDEETEREFFETTHRELARAGFPAYEISNFAPPGRECRHNLNYWRAGEYFGLGPGAHSHLLGERSSNRRSLGHYIAELRAGRLPRDFAERLPRRAAFGEAVMLGLRTVAGVSRGELLERFGFDLATVHAETIARHASAALVDWDGESLRVRPEALVLADSIAADFLEPAP